MLSVILSNLFFTPSEYIINYLKLHCETKSTEIIVTMFIFTILIIIVVLVILILTFDIVNSMRVGPIVYNKKYYIIYGDNSGEGGIVPKYLNASSNGLKISYLPLTTWTFIPQGSGNTNLADARGVILQSNIGQLTNTNNVASISSKGSTFIIQSIDSTYKKGFTGKTYTIGQSGVMLANDNNKISFDDVTLLEKVNYRWRFAPAI